MRKGFFVREKVKHDPKDMKGRGDRNKKVKAT